MGKPLLLNLPECPFQPRSFQKDKENQRACFKLRSAYTLLLAIAMVLSPAIYT